MNFNHPESFALVIVAGAASGNFICGGGPLWGTIGSLVGIAAGMFVVYRVRKQSKVKGSSEQ